MMGLKVLHYPLKRGNSIQRKEWHKRENVTSYLPKGKQDEIKRPLQNAYDLPTYKDAKAALDAIKPRIGLDQ